MSNRSTLLLEHHLKELKLPTFLREYRKLAAHCAQEGTDHLDYLLRLAELELIDRHQRMVQRRIRAARFPATKSLDTFDFLTIPSVNKPLVMQLARCEYVEHRENVIAIATAAPARPTSPWAWAWPPASGACPWASPPPPHWSTNSWRPGMTADCSTCSGSWPASICSSSTSWASCRCPPPARNCSSRSSASATSAAPSWSPPTSPFDEWTEVFGSERLTGALLDRLTHHVHIIEMNSDSYRLKGSRQNAVSSPPEEPADT